MTTSADFTASGTSATLSPAPSAFAREEEPGPQAHGDIDARVVEVAGVRMSLGAVTDDRNLLALDDREVAILVVVHLHGGLLFLCGPSLRGRTLKLPNRPLGQTPRGLTAGIRGDDDYREESSLRKMIYMQQYV